MLCYVIVLSGGIVYTITWQTDGMRRTRRRHVVARRSHRPLVTSSVLSPLIVTYARPIEQHVDTLQRVTSLRRREKTPYIYCVVLVASHHGVAWWRNGRASDLRSRRREFDSRPRRGCVTTLVVTFFNHNFVNCKATLILAIKIY